MLVLGAADRFSVKVAVTGAPQLLRLSHTDFDIAQLAATRERTVAVVVPARDEQATITATVEVLVGLRRQGLIDRVIVADDSRDATPTLAAQAGAEVVRQADLRAEAGPVRGKGDAMWRGLSVVEEDIVCFVDADSSDFSACLPAGLLGAVLTGGVAFAKGTYRRPFHDTQGWQPTGGGRVTELVAKPLLRRFFPEVAAFDQPLAGEIAAETHVLRALPMATNYAVDVALLIDVWRAQGLGRLAEVDLGTRQNRHRPLAELAPMADTVVAAILSRAGVLPGDADEPLPFDERPPLAPTSIA